MSDCKIKAITDSVPGPRVSNGFFLLALSRVHVLSLLSPPSCRRPAWTRASVFTRFFSLSRACSRFLSHSYVCRALPSASAIATAVGDIGRSGISEFSLIISRALAFSFFFPPFFSFAAVISRRLALSSALAFALFLVHMRDKTSNTRIHITASILTRERTKNSEHCSLH